MLRMGCETCSATTAALLCFTALVSFCTFPSPPSHWDSDLHCFVKRISPPVNVPLQPAGGAVLYYFVPTSPVNVSEVTLDFVFLLTSLFEWWHTVSLVSKAHFNPSLTLTLNLLNSLLTSAESNKVCVSFTLNHREVKKTPPEAPSTPSDSNCDLLADGQTDWVYICTDVKMFAGFLPVRCSQSFSVFERPLL